MTMIDTLHDLLEANGITTQYTTQQLQTFITQAKLLVNAPFTTDTTYEDYVNNFQGYHYVTHYYPIKNTSQVTITTGDKNIKPYVKKITPDGRIFFDREIRGDLEIRYTVGLREEDINNYILPITLEIIKDKEGKNIASVSEGDVSVSYGNRVGGNGATSIDTLIYNLKNKYGARVRLI